MEIYDIEYSNYSFTIVTTNRGDHSKICLYDLKIISEDMKCVCYKTISIPDIISTCVHQEAPYFIVGTQSNYIQIFDVVDSICKHHLKSHGNFFRMKSNLANGVFFTYYDYGLVVASGSLISLFTLD